MVRARRTRSGSKTNSSYNLGIGGSGRMRFAALAVALLATITIAAQDKKMTTASPEVIFVNGNIWTGVAAKPHATALAVSKGTVTAVGTDAEMKKVAGKNTHVVDLGGRFAMPGFNDAHLHFA